MKTTVLFVILFLWGQLAISQTVINGKIDNYAGEANDILVNPFFPETVGKINAAGEFEVAFDEAYIKKLKKQIEIIEQEGNANITQSTLKKFQTRYQCEDSDFSFSDSELQYSPLLERIGFMVGNLETNNVTGVINLVSSPDFAKSQVFNPQNDPSTGYILDWYYVEEMATANGDCNKRMTTGNGDETYTQEVKVDLNLHPGWNLVKYEISQIYTDKNGKKYTQSHSYSTLDEIPEGVKFIYSKK